MGKSQQLQNMINRFTKEAKENRYTSHDYDIITEVPGDEEDMQQYANNKLGRYEDIEDKLGVELSTLFKALKGDCFVKTEDNRVIETIEGFIGEDCSYIHFDVYGEDYKNLYDVESIYVDTKDYGKTWALTKEELE